MLPDESQNGKVSASSHPAARDSGRSAKQVSAVGQRTLPPVTHIKHRVAPLYQPNSKSRPHQFTFKFASRITLDHLLVSDLMNATNSSGDAAMDSNICGARNFS